jgi:hypothetical protein
MHGLRIRGVLVAMVALLAVGISTAAHADSGTIRLTVFKGGWFVGASGGSGILVFHDKMYPISVGGLSAGLVFGASETSLSGRVTNITRPSDVEGVYGAGGAGVAIVKGVQGIVLTNQKGALLQLGGSQMGLMVNADLSGLAITLK